MTEMKDILPFLMIIERHPVRDLFSFRLAGTAWRKFTGREMTGTSLATLWSEQDAKQVATCLGNVVAKLQPQKIIADGSTESGRETSFEAVFLPVFVDGRKTVQILGALLPLNEPFWLGSQPITHFRLISARSLSQSQTPHSSEMVS
ncbi:hypothetical protein FHS85_003422 [Rhodoligotrophos appendicifer]